jgi:hypothetical protein
MFGTKNGTDRSHGSRQLEVEKCPLSGERSDIAGLGVAVFGERVENANCRLTLESLVIRPERIPAR